MNNSLQLKSKESIIQELVDSYKHVNQALPHINRGGCGIFAEKLYIKCKALGLDPKIIVLTRCSEQMNERLKNEGEYLHKLFNDYRFNYPTQGEIEELVIPFGYGCIYNHSNDNNAIWKDHPYYKAFQFIAVKDIEPGEEICTYYGGDSYWNDGRNHVSLL